MHGQTCRGLKGASAPLSHVKRGHMSGLKGASPPCHMSNVVTGLKGGFGPLVGVKGGLRPPCRVTECAEWYLSL